MLKIDTESKRLLELDQSSLIDENILERFDLQEMIVNSWGNVRKNIGIPTSFIVGKEIKPHDSISDSIDILAFNPEDSALVVIELKRDKNKYQLLQSLNYAAMISSWDSQKVVDSIQAGISEEAEELRDVVSGTELNSEIGIILISEIYDPEVIITSDWLSSNYGLNISAFAVEIHKLQGESFLSFKQRYPLKELADIYETRRSKRKQSLTQEELTWEEVIPKLDYPFAEKAISICQKHSQGSPKRRRFGSIRSNFDGFSWISINFRKKYINVYTKVNKEHGTERVKQLFGENIEINEWRDGISFLLRSEPDFEKLTDWLSLKS
jgi:hypothetical protein